MSESIRHIEQHIPYLRGLARSLAHNPVMAEDLLQECLTRAIAKKHLYRDGTNLRAWLSTILHNLFVSEVRRIGRWEGGVDPDDVLRKVATGPAQHDHLMLQAVSNALDRMPSEHALVILLVGVEGRSYEEVSKLLGVPVGTVKSRVSRARSHLRAVLDGEEAREAA